MQAAAKTPPDTAFWKAIGRSFPLVGIRAELEKRVGPTRAVALIRAGLLRKRGVASVYPCPRPGGARCPRRIVLYEDGSSIAVCSNSPPECDDLALAPGEADQFILDTQSFVSTLSSALCIAPRFEPIAGLPRTFHVGGYLPEPGVRYPVYLVAQPSPTGTRPCVHGLRVRHGNRPFAVLLPTDTALDEALGLEARGAGVQILILEHALAWTAQGTLVPRSQTEDFFAGLGHATGTVRELGPRYAAGEDTTFVVAHFPEGARRLSEDAYRAVIDHAAEYDVVVDEPGRRIFRRQGKKVTTRDQVPASWFEALRALVTARFPVDPSLVDAFAEHEDSKQIFRRMRLAVDSRNTDGAWRLIQTVLTEDRRATYAFRPSGEVTFSFLFLAGHDNDTSGRNRP